MFKPIFFAFVLAVTILCAQSTEHIRILKLLPYVVHPPLVDPALPASFILGQREGDPFFTLGYYWGSKKNLEEYFNDPTTLSGCLIRAQISTKVKQLGFDRFSCDENNHTLSAAGFTEIKTSKGKWGIFPYRELHVKGPRGRHYYQMWVGLNTDEGATLCFQFLYPAFLHEPTQDQKNIWHSFVRNTSLLGITDLLIARGVDVSSTFIGVNPLSKYVQFIVEKRRVDQKLFIQVIAQKTSAVTVQAIKDLPFISDFSLGQSFVEIEVSLATNKGEKINEKIRVPYSVVDQYSFQGKMLSLNRFQESESFLLFNNN